MPVCGFSWWLHFLFSVFSWRKNWQFNGLGKRRKGFVRSFSLYKYFWLILFPIALNFLYKISYLLNLTLDCPPPVPVLAIVLGVIAGIVILGLILLLVWKLLTVLHDRAEFAKFDNERLMAKWDTVCFIFAFALIFF